MKKSLLLMGIIIASCMGEVHARDCELSWDASPSAPPLKYNVYQNSEKVGTTELLEHVVTCNEGDKFFVTAVNQDNIESEPTNTLEVTFKPGKLLGKRI